MTDQAVQSAPKKKTPVILIAIIALVAFCVLCLVVSSAMDALGLIPTSTPTAQFQPEKPPQTKIPLPPTVNLTMDSRIEAGTLYIRGITDLPDGTILVYDVTHEQFATNLGIPAEKLHAEGFVTVTNQSYSTSIDLAGWQAGKLTVWVAFQTILGTDKKQPPDIISRFGELGEKLQGDNVTSTGGMNRVTLETILEFNP